jgi:hypothetical protein
MLAGDLLMPERGRMAFGTYLGNPRHFWHAPMISQGGALMLYETDAPQGPWGIRDYPRGKAIAEAYFDTESWSELAVHRDWKDLSR